MVNQVLAEKYLEHFIKQAWHIVEPKKPLMWSWHLGAICEHLQAVSGGEINYLIINIPPREMKSLTTSVFWPTWEWGPCNTPWIRYLFSSYAADLSKRDAVKSRRIINSEWYQRNWGENFTITSDQNQKTRYDNNKSGYRIATSVKGLGTGEGGDRIVCDDPHNVKQAESDSIRGDTITWWDEEMSSRIDDETTGAFVLIGQRTHFGDLFGHLIEKDAAGEIDLVKLILPARFEKERELSLQTRTPLDFVDPRSKEGEVLDKKRFPKKLLNKRESRMTPYAVAGQHQQRPAPRGGGMFKVENFILLRSLPKARIKKRIRYWDKAATQDGGKRSAGTLMFELEETKRFPQWLIVDCVKGQWAPGKRELIIRQVADLDGEEVDVWVEQEGGSGGKESALGTIKNLSGYKVYADPVSGNKEVRAEPYAVQVEAGNMGLLVGDWTKAFIAEHEKAPLGVFSDQWDSAAGAFNKLNVKRKKGGVWGR